MDYPATSLNGLTELASVGTESHCAGSCASCPMVGSCGDRIVCRCLSVTEETIISAIQSHGIQTIRELKLITRAGDGCRCCQRELRQYLAIYSRPTAPVEVASAEVA